MKKEQASVTAKRIKELRLKNGYTIERLAKLINVSKGTISKWENGYVDNMRQDMISKLSEVFNVPPTYIMGYERLEKYVKAIAEQDKNSQNHSSGNENMSKEQKERLDKFIDLYSKLGKDEQSLVDNMLEALSKKQ